MRRRGCAWCRVSPVKGWEVGAECGRGPGSEHRVAPPEPPVGPGAGMGLLVWALGVGIRQAPFSMSYLSKFTSVSIAFWEPLCPLPARNK